MSDEFPENENVREKLREQGINSDEIKNHLENIRDFEETLVERLASAEVTSELSVDADATDTAIVVTGEFKDLSDMEAVIKTKPADGIQMYSSISVSDELREKGERIPDTVLDTVFGTPHPNKIAETVAETAYHKEVESYRTEITIFAEEETEFGTVYLSTNVWVTHTKPLQENSYYREIAPENNQFEFKLPFEKSGESTGI